MSISSYLTHFVALLVATFFPFIAFGQSFSRVGGEVSDSIETIATVANAVVGLIFVLAVAFLAWHLFLMVMRPDQDTDKRKGIIFNALVVIFIMFSFWGILRIVGSAIGIEFGENSNIPEVPSFRYDGGN